MAQLIHTTIDIDAPPERVWALLTDLERYREWNPFVVRASGEVAPGQTLEVHPLSGGREHTFRPVVRRYESGRAFSWVGTVIHPWIAGGEHVFELQPLSPSGTRLNHDEQFFGLTGSLITAFTRARVIRAFNAMNDALKQEAEKPPASSL